MSIVEVARAFAGKLLVYAAFTSVLGSPAAWAVHVPISAKFTPNPNNPRINTFVNLTPNSGYCALKPQECVVTKSFSIRVNTRFTPRAISKGEHVFIKAPYEWKKVTVVHPVAGPQEVEVRIVGIGSTYFVNPTVATIIGPAPGNPGLQSQHATLWGGGLSDWIYAPAPCVYSGTAGATLTQYNFYWKVQNSGTCSKTAAYDIPAFRFENMDFSYELRTPNPLAMYSGVYTGSLLYEVGPNKDFDFSHLVPSDSAIVLDFSLEVIHALKVEIPPGGHRVELIPDGGWQRWLNSGRAPPRLFRDQSFLMSASTPFKMYVECEGGSGRYCYLSDETKTSMVPVEVSVTLPSGFTDNSGAMVHKRALTHIQGITSATSGAALQVRPGFYVNRSPAMLHFEVPKEGVDEALKRDGSAHYSGRITVIWDADI